ncbi:MAG: 6,7-dimethyl-8-ribityllumazine synthase [Gammaproteobacteria bacterium]
MAKFDLEKKVEGAKEGRFGIVASRFNQRIVEPLLDGALHALAQHGIAQTAIKVVRVPGAFEIPLVAQRLAASDQFDAVIALGAVVRGDTPHFEYVAGECVRGIAKVGLDFSLPVIFGVLTVDNMDQAMARAGGREGNKGYDAALAALEMVALLRNLPA